MKNLFKYLAVATVLSLLLPDRLSAQSEYPNNDSLRRFILTAGDSIMKGHPTISQAEVISQLSNPLGKNIKISGKPSSKKPDDRDIYRMVKPATLIIGMIHRGTKDTVSQVNLASGYVIDGSGICVTNYHVMLAYAYSNVAGQHALVVRNGAGKNFPVSSILYASAENDIVVFQIRLAPKETVPSLALSASDAEVGDAAYVIGHPNSVFFHFTKGIVANTYTDKVQTLNSNLFNYRKTMAITADYGTGSSGGPVLDCFGNAIGTVSNTRPIMSEGSGRNTPQMIIKNTIPVSTLKSLLSNQKQSNIQ